MNKKWFLKNENKIFVQMIINIIIKRRLIQPMFALIGDIYFAMSGPMSLHQMFSAAKKERDHTFR